MARILYFSTHEPLEYDDVMLFRSMGHTIFPLGMSCPVGPREQMYRPELTVDDDLQILIDIFLRENCTSQFKDITKTNLTRSFIDEFDIIISIQDVGFIARYWDWIRHKVVIWRTVGQAIDHADAQAAPFRKEGLKIVRWCAREMRAPVYVGHDAIIRAYKDPDQYGAWNGGDNRILTFSNQFNDRYPIELGIFERVLHDLPYAIGGGGNEGLRNAIGIVPFSDMRGLLNAAGAYFYCHGSTVPYTLNYIEAWMTGVPLVALSREVHIHNIGMKYNEIAEFIVHGENGFLVDTEAQARGVCRTLLEDRQFAMQVGSAGRRSAITLFGKDRIAAEWQRFLDRVS